MQTHQLATLPLDRFSHWRPSALGHTQPQAEYIGLGKQDAKHK